MSKFNPATARAVGRSVINTEAVSTGRTHQGGAGFARDAKSELFLLAVTNFVSESTAYELGSARDSRFAELVRTVAVADTDWLTRFARWLRESANMRSASLVLALEAARALVKAKLPGGRQIVDSVLQRADEPGEAIGYWHSHYGRRIPIPVKKGIRDAVTRLYTERSYIKYDSDSKGYRFADVIQLVHPNAKSSWQSELFRYAIEARIGKEGLEIPDSLNMLFNNAVVRQLSAETIKVTAESGNLSELLSEAGFTWEALPSLVNGPWTKELWEAIIPSMGYMALLRNLRNFDEAGVSDEVAAKVAARLSDPDEVARSRQLPMRFLSAFRAAPSLRWAYPLEKALDRATDGIPYLPGTTLILIDTSGSMNGGFSKDGTVKRWDAAVTFGLALARRCDHASVISYSSSAAVFPQVRGESLLASINRWKTSGYFLNGGTQTAQALRAAYASHNRVVILTDEQTGGNYGRWNTAAVTPGDVIPAQVPLYTWNLAGYQLGHTAGGANRHTFGGLTDKGFDMIPLLERGHAQDWPF